MNSRRARESGEPENELWVRCGIEGVRAEKSCGNKGAGRCRRRDVRVFVVTLSGVQRGDVDEFARDWQTLALDELVEFPQMLRDQQTEERHQNAERV